MLEYITTEGERWDWISYMVYGDCCYYEQIIRANADLPEEIKLCPVLPGNICLKIPELTEEELEDLPPWRK